MTLKTMEEHLQASFTPEQKTALAGYKEKEAHAKAEKVAFQNLSKMQTVMEFENGQRDEVYKFLIENAKKKAAEGEAPPTRAHLMLEVLGVETDPYDLGLQTLMVETQNAGTMGQSGKDAAQQIREAINRLIEAKIDLLRPVLKENQLEQYRRELKANGFAFFGPTLDAMEMSGN